VVSSNKQEQGFLSRVGNMFKKGKSANTYTKATPENVRGPQRNVTNNANGAQRNAAAKGAPKNAAAKGVQENEASNGAPKNAAANGAQRNAAANGTKRNAAAKSVQGNASNGAQGNAATNGKKPKLMNSMNSMKSKVSSFFRTKKPSNTTQAP
jgi:hypothetical protein